MIGEQPANGQASTRAARARRRGARLLRWHAAALVAALLLGGGHGAFAQERTLQALEVQSLPGSRMELRLRFDREAPEPLAFTIDSPARIALDLVDTAMGMNERRRDVNAGPLGAIQLAEGGGRTRVVLNLVSMVPYQTRVAGNELVVTLGDDAARVPAPTFPVAPQAQAAVAQPAERAIRNVDFRRTADGAGRVEISLSQPNIAVDVRQEGNRVLVSFHDTQLPQELLRRLDVGDFATPVRLVDAVRTDRGAQLAIQSAGAWEHMAYQTDERFVVEIVESRRNGQPASWAFDPGREYTGQRMNLNFQNIETRAVLQLLAETSEFNIVVSDAVSGSVTLRLNNVPWDQALDLVMMSRGLDMRQNGNVILVAPAAEIAAQEQAQMERLRRNQELEPLRSEFVQVNYARATELAQLIQGGGGERRLLSERGSVAIDSRTNTLLVQDTPQRLEDVRRMVQTLDVPVRQVLIEARVVVVSDDFSRELGVRLGATNVSAHGSDGLFTVTGRGAGADATIQSALANRAAGNPIFPVQVGALDQRYNVNLPIAGPAGSLALAVLGSNTLVDLELSALQAEGRAEVVSSPRVITANQREASIEQGVQIPFQEASASGATATSFREAVLSLQVVPQITPDDRIVMDLVVSNDTVGEVVPSATGGFVPSIDTRRISTQVLVNDGETVVLGGIYETERRDVASKVPLLGDIPLLGHLFRSTQTVSSKAELLIFVTPKILREGATVQ